MEDWGVVELLLILGLRWRRVYDEFHTPAVLPCQYPPYSTRGWVGPTGSHVCFRCGYEGNNLSLREPISSCPACVNPADV